MGPESSDENRVPVDGAPANGGLWARVAHGLRADSGRLWATGFKAAVWLWLASFALNRGGIIAALLAGALAADVVAWFFIRILELPKHLWAFQIEAVVNLTAVWLLLDVMHLFDAFRGPDEIPFGVAAFMIVGVGRVAVWWVGSVIDA